MWFIVVLVVFSIILQIAAMLVSIKLVRVTEKRWVWFMFFVALLFMSIRCLVVGYFTYIGQSALHIVYFISEGAVFLVSLFMLLGVTGIIPIISVLKRCEKKEQENEADFRTMIDLGVDWNYWLKPEGGFLYISPSCKQITGYAPDEFINNPGLMLDIVGADDKEIVGNHFNNITTDACSGFKFRIITKFGDVRWLSHSCQAIFDDDGKFLGRYGNNRDITDQENESATAKYRLNFEKIVAQISIKFGQLRSSDVVQGIKYGLTKTSEFTDFDRCNIFLISDDKEHKECVYEWQKEGVGANCQWPQKYPIGYFQTLTRGFAA